MDLNLKKACVDSKLAVEINNNSVMCSENDYNNESPVISVGGGPEDRDEYFAIIYDSQDSRKLREGSKTRANKYVNDTSSRKNSKVKEPTVKRRKLDNSKSKYKQHDSVTHSKQKTKPNEIGKKSAVVISPLSDNSQQKNYESSCSTHFSSVVDSGFVEWCTDQKAIKATKKNAQSDLSKYTEKNSGVEKNSETYDGDTESDGSNVSTYFSEFEDDECDDTSLEIEVENSTKREKGCVQLLNKSTSINSSTHKNSTFYYIRLLLDVLADENLTLEYMKSSTWSGTKAKKAVHDFVRLAESNNSEVTLQQCKTEAIKALQKVYERFLKSSNTRALDKSTRWSNHFSILLTLCDSKNICEEFIKFFTSRMITPKSTTDLEDPKKIIEGLAEYETASFGLILLHNVLRKYVKMVEESDCESNICSESSDNQQESLDVRRQIEPTKSTLDFQLLRRFNEYKAKNSVNFPELNYINIALLKSIKYSGTSR